MPDRSLTSKRTDQPPGLMALIQELLEEDRGFGVLS
jgi:hypothetical protein